MRLKLAVVGLLCSTLLSATDYGLVIGCCGEYKNLSLNGLGGTTNDAKAFESILLDRGCSRNNLVTLTNHEATKSNIKQKLLMLEGKLQPGDRLYFYFSGHGARATDRKEVFLKEIIDGQDIKKRLNRTALITYDYDTNNRYNSSLISFDDLRPVFQRLDRKGIQVIMFADACFVGLAYTRGSLEEEAKAIREALSYSGKKPNDAEDYRSLIFFGASLNKLQAREKDTINGKRGEFTTYLELCFNGADTDRNRDGEISKSELQKCMQDEFQNFATETHVYPYNNRLSQQFILKAPRAVAIDDKHLIKVRYRGKENLAGIAKRVDSGYDLDLVNNGNEIDIYRMGSLYASVDKRQIAKYLKAYRLFSLKSNNPNVKLDYRSEDTGKIEDTFCAGEVIRIRDKNLGNNYMTVLTLDKNGRVIILKSERDYSARAEVMRPYGVDRVKVFSYANRDIFNQTLAYQRNNNGILSSKDVNLFYDMLSQERTLKSQAFQIRTTATNIRKCLKGDR